MGCGASSAGGSAGSSSAGPAGRSNGSAYSAAAAVFGGSQSSFSGCFDELVQRDGLPEQTAPPPSPGPQASLAATAGSGPTLSHAVRHFAGVRVGHSSDQDRIAATVLSRSDAFYAAVFDGHGEMMGTAVADMAATNMTQMVRRHLGEASSAAAAGTVTGTPANAAGNKGAKAGRGNTASRGDASTATVTPSSPTPSPSPSTPTPQLQQHKFEEALTRSFLAFHNNCETVYNQEVVPHLLHLKKQIEAESGSTLDMKYPHEGGTTATSVLVSRNEMCVGWVGDSRAVLASYSSRDRCIRAVPLTEDHNVDNAREVERVAAAGGSSFGRYFGHPDVEGMLQLSRSLGDVPFHRRDILLAAPEVVCRPLASSDMFLVLASDGVWGALSNQDVISFVRDKLMETGYATCTNGPNALLRIAHSLEERATAQARSRGMRCDDTSIVLITFDAFWQAPELGWNLLPVRAADQLASPRLSAREAESNSKACEPTEQEAGHTPTKTPQLKVATDAAATAGHEAMISPIASPPPVPDDTRLLA